MRMSTCRYVRESCVLAHGFFVLRKGLRSRIAIIIMTIVVVVVVIVVVVVVVVVMWPMLFHPAVGDKRGRILLSQV